MNPTLGAAAADFLERTRDRVKPHTHRTYEWFLAVLVAELGPDAPLAGLTAPLVEAVSRRPAWSASTRCGFVGLLRTFFREAGHPLALRRPPKESRGADAVWTDAEFWQVYGAATGDLKPLLLVLRDTGARPGEVTGLTVESVDWDRGQARLKEHKNAGRGKARVMFFPTPALKVLCAQRRKYETGYLFRNELDAPFRCNGLHVRLKRTRERAGVERPITAYGLRHTFATKALEQGFSGEQVAALIGTSAAMIERHYGHVTANARLLTDIAARLAGPVAPPGLDPREPEP